MTRRRRLWRWQREAGYPVTCGRVLYEPRPPDLFLRTLAFVASALAFVAIALAFVR